VGLQLPKRARKSSTRIGTVFLVSTSLLLLGACSTEDQEQIRRLAMPEPATDRAPFIDDLWKWSWVAAAIVGVLVWGLILYAAFKFRRRSDDEVPVQTRYNLPIEILYTVAPIVMVLVFFFFTVQTQNDVLASASESGEADHEINVVGQQWSWTFNYLEDEALGGSTSVYEGGTTADRPTLVLPVDETIRVELASPDVIHSFWVPAFLFKMDVVPGRANSFSFTPTREGEFVGRCAELCGAYHSRMLFNVEVVSAEEYAAHLQELADQGNTGVARGGSDADTQVGIEEEVQDNDTSGGEAE
jgi:cytochrome c oxidase subunit 2